MTIDEADKLVFEELNYNSYLKIPELLDLQQLISKPAHHDEMFFIIIHQASELWIKLLAHETGVLIESFREGHVSRSLKVLKRMNAVMTLMEPQIRLLATLTPVEFAGFRDDLNPASGFQSAGFRKFEFTYGLRDEFFLKFFEKLMPEVREELEVIAKTPTVWDEFLISLSKAGYAVPEEVLSRDVSKTYQEPHPEVEAVIGKIYENPGDNYHLVLVFEALLDFDEAMHMFRRAHLTSVERCIGRKQGTGGSSGVEFLEKRSNLRFFPELWSVRNQIGATYGP